MHQKEIHLLMEVKEYIASNLQRPLSLAAICRQFRTNKTSLQDRFREYWGITLHAFILQSRMERARSLLIESDLPVKYVSLQCGYRKIHSFSKAFRKKYHTSPGRYRKHCPTVESHLEIVESHLV